MGCLRNVCMRGVSDGFFLRDESIASNRQERVKEFYKTLIAETEIFA